MSVPARATALVAACALVPGPLPVAFSTAFSATAHAATPATAPTPPPRATDNGAWSVGPANRGGALAGRPSFAPEALPGGTVRDAVRVVNLTDGPLTFRLYAADAYNTPRDAGFALRSADEESRSVGAWTRLGAQSLKLPPGTAREVPFTITVPADATPGEHIGGIVALNETIESVRNEDGARIGVRRAVAARVYLRVTGPASTGVRADAVTVAHSAPLVPVPGRARGTVRYTVVNTGNLRIAPEARVWATGVFGRDVREWPKRRLPELLPGQSVAVELPWDGPPQFDAVTVRIELTAADGAVHQARAGFVAVPWAALIGLVGSIVLVWSVLPRLIRRWRSRAGLTGSRR